MAPPRQSALSVKVERPKSLTELAIDQIRAAIVRGELGFGEALSESVLAATLGISKTPVREALLHLKMEGLVEVHPQRGTFVFQLGEAEVANICRFRSMIECEALADGMEHRPEALIQALEKCLDDMAAAFSKQQHDEFPRLDTEFHNAIIESCANGYIQSAYMLVAAQLTALRYRLPAENSQVTHCQDNHRVVVDAIRANDAARAQAILREHIQSTEQAYLIACRNMVAPARGDRAAV
jgi:DNA-binding GntR family transcriptional regulator